MSKWKSTDAGPIQVKRVNKAISELNWEGKTFVEVTGVKGGEENRWTMTEPFSSVREEVQQLHQEIGEQFEWTVTKQNAKEIVAAFAAIMEKAAESRPERDLRREPEEDAELKRKMAEREEGYRKERQKKDALREQVKAKAPAGAKAVIVAAYHVDTSDPMTDYFANRTEREVAIGFRFSAREDFRALRAAAGQFPETKHLGPEADKDIEHRDNYSMGKGNYLSDHGWDGSGTGWVVKSYPLDGNWWSVTEDAIPELPEGQSNGKGLDLVADGYEIRPSSLGRPGVVEVHFDQKPSPETLATLKAAGFRWARGNRCWYGKEERLPALS
jgi:hypothetical protein